MVLRDAFCVLRSYDRESQCGVIMKACKHKIRIALKISGRLISGIVTIMVVRADVFFSEWVSISLGNLTRLKSNFHPKQF